MKHEGPKRRKRVESSEDDQPKSPSRRSFLTGAGAAVGILGLAVAAPHIRNIEKTLDGTGTTEDASEAARQIEIDQALEAAKPEIFPTGRLATHRIGGLFEGYLGHPKLAYADEVTPPIAAHVTDHSGRYPRHPKHHGKENVVPHSLSLNFPHALNGLWEAKKELLAKKNKHSPTIDADAYERVLDYADRWNSPENFGGTREESLGRTGLLTTIETLRVRTDAMKEVFASSQGKAFFEESRHYNLQTEGKINTFVTLMQRITPTMITSYGLTELLPGNDGEFNVNFADFLLATAGKEFLASVPSLGDLLESIGQFQGTKYGVYDSSSDVATWTDSKIVRESASIPNAILPGDLQIPKVIGNIYTFEDHSAMAFLYAVHTLARAVSLIAKPYQEALLNIDDDTLVSFIATSHNNPSASMRAIDKWLDGRTKGKNTQYVDCCANEPIEPYAVKTENNFHALKKVQEQIKEGKLVAETN